MTFIDSEKEFNTVHIAAVLASLKQHGIEETYIRHLDDIYTRDIRAG